MAADEAGLGAVVLCLGFLPPSGRHGFLGDGAALRWRQGGCASMPALGCSQLAQSYGERVARVRCLGWLRRLAGRLLNDLPCQLIRIAGAFLSHTGIVACLPEQD